MGSFTAGIEVTHKTQWEKGLVESQLLCVLSVGALRGSICFRLVLLVLLVLPVGGLGVPIGGGGGYAVFVVVVVVLIFPVLDHSVGQRLPCSEPHPRFVCFLVGSTVIYVLL